VSKRLTIALAISMLAATMTSLMAGGLYQRDEVTAADALPAYEVLNTVRSLGFRPTTQALRRGPYYVLHAIDPRGIEVRIVADAQLGDIVSISPLLAPRYYGGPRIIHVPQPGTRDKRGSAYEGNNDDSAAGESEDAQPPATPAPRAPVRRPYQRMEAPPARASAEPAPRAKPGPKPLGLPRNVLSAPPPASALTPIYPTPRFDSKPAEKFAPPEDRSPTMPPGYMPAPPPRG
jgi:hypothetical protein